MVISPCLLDFLEQALEPLPLFSQSSNKKGMIVGFQKINGHNLISQFNGSALKISVLLLTR